MIVIDGQYSVVQRIGQGGSANVLEAVGPNGSVAVKILHPNLVDSAEHVRRFHKERRLLERFDHPALLAVLDHGVFEDCPYYVTRLLEGNLTRRLVQGALTVRGAARYLMEVLDALAYVHEQGIVHRDVKPDNILLSGDNVAVLTDFGIALDPLDRNTMVGDSLGTPTFAAPEQLENPYKAEPRSDLFSVGACLYTMITRESPMPLLFVGRREALLDELPATAREVIRKATETSPDARYGSARDMALALADL